VFNIGIDLREVGRKGVLGLSGSRQGPVAVCYEHGNDLE
jgi:hypothetical protein